MNLKIGMLPYGSISQTIKMKNIFCILLVSILMISCSKENLQELCSDCEYQIKDIISDTDDIYIDAVLYNEVYDKVMGSDCSGYMTWYTAVNPISGYKPAKESINTEDAKAKLDRFSIGINQEYDLGDLILWSYTLHSSSGAGGADIYFTASCTDCSLKKIISGGKVTVIKKLNGEIVSQKIITL